jgi:hypothetical protein
MTDKDFKKKFQIELNRLQDEVEQRSMQKRFDELTPKQKQQLAKFEGPSIMGELIKMVNSERPPSNLDIQRAMKAYKK